MKVVVLPEWVLFAYLKACAADPVGMRFWNRHDRAHFLETKRKIRELVEHLLETRPEYVESEWEYVRACANVLDGYLR